MKIDLTPNQLRGIILSHGWFALRPFEGTINPPSLKIVFENPIGRGAFEIKGWNSKTNLRVIEGSPRICQQIANQCLSLQIRPENLYALIRAEKQWRWVISNSIGRFLRSPSLFEDCCKAILSTNTTWQRTITMVKTLVLKYGSAIADYKAFPTPQKILKISVSKLSHEIGCGYRARYIHHLSEIAIRHESFFLNIGYEPLSDKEFYNHLIDVKGLGPSSVNYLSMLYWKPSSFVIDSYVRRRCNELWGLSSDQIVPFLKKRYESLGNLGPLMFWFELTKHWHTERKTFFETEW
jgi:endonuclease III-like uncharacterized protein